MRRLAGGWVVPIWWMVAMSAGAEPLAWIDFADGTSRRVDLVGDPPPIVEVDGAPHAAIGPSRQAMPIAWKAEMPNPTFPGGVGAGADTSVPAQSASIRLDLALDGPPDLVAIAWVYDLCEANSDSDSATLAYLPVDPKSRHSSASFRVSGDPYGSDPLYRPRPLPRTLPIFQARLDNGLDGADLVLSAKSRLCVRRIEFHPLAPSPLTDVESRRAEGMTDYQHLRRPASILDVWERDLAELVARQGQVYAAWSDTLRGDPQPVALAMDRFFHHGQAALARQELEEYATLLADARQALAALAAETERGQPPPLPPAATSNVHDPLKRVVFTTFANSSWEYWDPCNATGRYYPEYAIGTMGYLLGVPELQEDGSPVPASQARFLELIDRARARGWEVGIGVGHHQMHLTTLSLPGWLAKRAGDEGLYDVSPDGKELKGRFDIWNPHTRQYYLDAVEHVARLAAPNPHLSPWFYWGEPMSSSGYTPHAVRAFREYLGRKYGSIAALNQAWGSEYASFDSVEPPPSARSVPRRSATSLAYEHETFRRQGFNDWCRLTVQALRRGSPNARMWFEGWGRLDYLLSHGMDQLGIFDAVDMSACHTGSGGQLFQRTWQLALSQYSGTPQSDGEINIYGPYYNGCHSQAELHAAANSLLKQQVWSDVRQFMFWGGQLNMTRVYSYGGPHLYDGRYVSPLAWSGMAVREARRFADEVEPVLRRTRPVPSPVGILYSLSSFIQGWPYNEVEHETYPLHGMLYSSDYGYRFVHEEAIADGREDLLQLRVLFVPWGMWLKPAVAERLRQWVSMGGVLVASGPVSAYDHLGRPQHTLLNEVFGPGCEVAYLADERPGETALHPDSQALLAGLGDDLTTHFAGWAWQVTSPEPPADLRVVLKLADGTPLVCERPYRHGRFIVAMGPLAKNGLRAYLLDVVARKVQPLVQWTDHDRLQVCPRADAAGNLWLGVFNVSLNEEVADSIRLREPLEPLAVKLAPGEARILAIPGNGRASLTGDDLPTVYPPLPRTAAPAERRTPGGGTPAERAQRQALQLAAQRALAQGHPQRARLLSDKAIRRQAPPVEPPVDPGDLATARRARQAIAIDGKPDEWRGVPRFAVKSSGASGGDFAFQWDDRFLYVLAVARDVSASVPEEAGTDVNWIWVCDGILLVLNTCDSAPTIPCGALYDAPYRATQTATLVSTSGRRYANSAMGYSSASVRSAVQPIEGGWIMEAAIPLRQVMLPPLAGADVAFEFKIVDRGRMLGFARYADRESWLLDNRHFARLRLVD